MTYSGLVRVLTHAHIFLAMEIVFNLPVISYCLSPTFRRHLFAVRVRDGIDGDVALLAGAISKTSSLYAIHLAYICKLFKNFFGKRATDDVAFTRFISSMPVSLFFMSWLQAVVFFKFTLNGCEKARLISFDRENVEPPFSAIFITVSLLV